MLKAINEIWKKKECLRYIRQRKDVQYVMCIVRYVKSIELNREMNTVLIAVSYRYSESTFEMRYDCPFRYTSEALADARAKFMSGLLTVKITRDICM